MAAIGAAAPESLVDFGGLVTLAAMARGPYQSRATSGDAGAPGDNAGDAEAPSAAHLRRGGSRSSAR